MDIFPHIFPPIGETKGEPEKRNAPKENGHRLRHCPYRQNKKLFCGEANCYYTDCPIWLKESGLLAESINHRD